MRNLLLIILLFTTTLFAQLGNVKRGLGGNQGNVQDAYCGVQYNLTTDAFSRVGSTKDVAVSIKPDESLIPVQAKMRRCLLADDGTNNGYLDPLNSYLMATGDSADLSGANGQLVVAIPKFYMRYSKTGSVYEWLISPEPLTGFSLPGAYLDKNGNVIDTIYIGAMPGVLWDASAGAYLDSSYASIYASGDKLASVVGYKPSTNETRAEFRAACMARGTGWHQLDNEFIAVVQLLFITEYADFDIQSVISAGNTKFSAWNYSLDISQTGKSLSDGNYSNGQSTTSGDSLDYVSYRGIEDIFGNTWQFVDGVNINNDGTSSKLYLSTDYTYYADDVSTNYSYVGDLAEADGYGKALVNTQYGFYPLTVGGSSSTYLCDYYYTYFDNQADVGWRVVRVGGSARDGATSGVFIVHAYYGSSFATSDVGARVCFGSN